MAEKTWKDSDLGKSPEVLFAERSKRLKDAIELRQPDRVPISIGFSYMLAEYGGITKQEMHENPKKTQEILEKAALYFQPDGASGGAFFSGPDIAETIGDRMLRWPGHGIGENDAFQFAEDEYMLPDDYDDYLFDPADWGIRKLFPRSASNLKGFAKLGNLGMLCMGTAYGNIAPFSDPEVQASLAALKKAAQLSMNKTMQAIENGKRMQELGFPMGFLDGPITMASAPFDELSDTLRGMRGIFLDMRRRPDKLLAAIDKTRELLTKNALSDAKNLGVRFAGSMLHRGSDGFMSLEQFEKFYWPSLKGMWLDLIDAGITPWVFYEGVWDQRLKYLAELPKGKTVGMFQSSDIFKVKEVLGDTMCIVGGMPNSMLQGGTVDQVRAFTKRLCLEVGKGGGYIMGPTIGEMEGSKPELVKAWIDATKEFGVYA